MYESPRSSDHNSCSEDPSDLDEEDEDELSKGQMIYNYKLIYFFLH